MAKPLIILGGGGHAAVLLDILLQNQCEIAAIVCPELDSDRVIFHDIPHYRHDNDVSQFASHNYLLVNGIGSIPKSTLRADIYEKFKALGYEFKTVIASSAQISDYATIASGTQIIHGAIIQSGVEIGENTIINTSSVIEHDCRIGINNHIAPGAILGGEVVTKENVFVGIGALIIPSIKIHQYATIGAGAVVTNDILEKQTVYSSKISKLNKR